ncbi:hypothetical protein LRAMOSA11292 [Lichtheimia ramosa]|uniref:Uncharacterized protein n=1 Tax=Lichtheimia ramosa TaxID=688394 RepID=A0A077WT77_9FUNG|nr:hypothetical protein LRAMOSA11292 [Lichtheimia ramosa]
MRPEVIDLVSESSSDSSSVNGDNNVLNEQQAPCGVMTEKASQLRESLKNKGWIEVDAENVKDDIDRIYASEGEVWIYKSKGINPEKAAIKAEQVNNGQSTAPKARRLEFRIHESHYYDCHRARKKQIRPWRPDDDTVHRRNIVRPSKKAGCKARLTVRFYLETPGIAFVRKTKDHDTHTPGDPEEIGHLPTRKRVFECIPATATRHDPSY